MGVRTSRDGCYSVGELSERLVIPESEIEDLLEGKYCPNDLKTRPGSGNYRRVTRGQAFNLGVIFAFKQFDFGFRASTHFADLVRKEMPFATRVLCADPGFRPYDGLFEDRWGWFAELDQLRHVRFATYKVINDHEIDDYEIQYYEGMYYSKWAIWEDTERIECDHSFGYSIIKISLSEIIYQIDEIITF